MQIIVLDRSGMTAIFEWYKISPQGYSIGEIVSRIFEGEKINFKGEIIRVKVR